MRKGFLLLLLIAFFSLTSPAFADHITIASGIPIKKMLCDINGCQQIPITQQNQSGFRMSIVSFKDSFFWGSRDKKPLIASYSKEFYSFVAPGGEGYIKISTEDGKTVYVEHMTLGFKNITYWGVVDQFTPPKDN